MEPQLCRRRDAGVEHWLGVGLGTVDRAGWSLGGDEMYM